MPAIQPEDQDGREVSENEAVCPAIARRKKSFNLDVPGSFSTLRKLTRVALVTSVRLRRSCSSVRRSPNFTNHTLVGAVVPPAFTVLLAHGGRRQVQIC